MAVQAVRPNPVLTLADLSQVEANRHNTVWIQMERAINENPQIPDDNRQAVIEAAASTINDFALNRGFYSHELAQAVEIDVQVAPKIIVQQSENIGSTIKRTFIQALFGALGWQIASFNPAAGVAVGVTGLVANSKCCQEKIERVYK